MHTEKQEIFDKYAKSKGFEDFDDLVFTTVHTYNSDSTLEHIYAACDLVQQEQQKRIAEKAELFIIDDSCSKNIKVIAYLNSPSVMDMNGNSIKIDEDSILNPENLIQ